MAYASNTLVNISGGPPGSSVYHHDAGDDTMATVAAAGYFNNTDDNLNLAVDDVILSICSDGDMFHRVVSLSSGSVTTAPMSFEGPWNGTFGSASVAVSLGINEDNGTASTYTLAAPVIGRKLTIYKSTTSSGHVFTTDSTGTTLNAAGDRTITLDAVDTSIELLAVSATRWVILNKEGATLS